MVIDLRLQIAETDVVHQLSWKHNKEDFHALFSKLSLNRCTQAIFLSQPPKQLGL